MNQTAAAGFENLIGYYDPPVQVRSFLSLIEPFSDLLSPINFGACFRISVNYSQVV